MNTTELLKQIFQKLGRQKFLVILGGLAFGALLCFYAITKRPGYTAKSTVFPLTTPSDNALSSSTLSGLLGLGDAPKSFSSEAAINIIELTLSRYVRESVALTRLPQFGNKRIVELLVDDMNEHKYFFSKTTKLGTDTTSMAMFGGELLKPMINAKMSKNGVLELYFTCRAKELVTPISFAIIDKISQFYTDLKIKKALVDYKFTLGKIDSLQTVVSGIDQRAVSIQNTTMFTPNDRLEYELPKDNLSAEKQRAVRQREMSINNREEALWRLQKVTPIIQVLDKPTEPFDVDKPSPVMFAVSGLIAGCLITSFLLVFGILYRFVKSEANRNLFGEEAAAS